MKDTSVETPTLDSIMLNIAKCLIRDFQTNLDDPTFCSDYYDVLCRGNLSEIRDFQFADGLEEDSYRYKAIYQLQNLFKRYRFENDIYTNAELEEKAITDFLFTQHRLEALNFDNPPVHLRKVIDYASGWISRVLGDYDDEECRRLARHGRKASVGVPARNACEAARWEIPISGSQQQIDWFDSEMSQYCEVVKYMTLQYDRDPERRSCYQETSALNLVLVPKTFKALRAILPNTTIGSYQSLGIGEMIRIRLKRVGFDIRRLQMKHRILAQKASVHGKHVTADLSSASDSISVPLAEQLLPPDWFELLNRMRIVFVKLPDGTLVRMNSFCTMGIGYTFPLQTLMFLALLKGIHHVFRKGHKQGLISVYGDDMIYSRDLHVFVVYCFWQLGFLVNESKTFASGHFRESCGGDYYYGVDVRPFQPRDEHVGANKVFREAVLYKWINGLLRRWSEHELGRTLGFLCSQLELVVTGAKVVPGDFPDEAGIKCPTLGCWVFLQHVQTLQPKHLGHGIYRFIYLKFSPKMRLEHRHEPYYWASLRASESENFKTLDYSSRSIVHLPPIVDRINKAVGAEMKEPLLITKMVSKKSSQPYHRSKITGRRLRRSETYTTISGMGFYRRQAGTSCFEDRR